jgi:transposase, IS5 family
MVRYTSQFQTKIDEFSSLYQLQLNPNNRWIQLAALLPWDKMINIYKKKFSREMGAPSINPRFIIGAFIIKHKLGLSDEETLQTISENPYMQFFLGLEDYRPNLLFSSSLFVEARKKLGNDTFDEFSELIIRSSNPNLEHKVNNKAQHNKGHLKIDATVADQYIRYPNDLSLVNEARLKTEKIIDLLYEQVRNQMPVKPRTYRKLAHKRYLQEAKKKQKSVKSIRKSLRYLLNCVERNLKYIHKMLDMLGNSFPLETKYQKQLWVIHTLYDQQRKMYDENNHSVDDRIVSISQPHVRPIVRGKQGKSVEFGSKLGLSLVDGYLTNETLSWDAYNESSDLQKQAETYRLLFGYYPELIQADKIYATNQNRAWCKERGIRLTATPKGRPVEKTARQKRKEKKEYAERNHIEGRIGNAKQVLSLNQIKAKLKDTSQTWIAAVIFVLNLSKFASNLNATF